MNINTKRNKHGKVSKVKGRRGEAIDATTYDVMAENNTPRNFHHFLLSREKNFMK